MADNKFNFAGLEAVLAKMVLKGDGAEPAVDSGKVVGLINGLFFLLGAAGLTYDAGLPLFLAAIIVIFGTILAILIPYFQGHWTRGQVFSPATVAAIIGALKDAEAAGGEVLGGTKPVATDKIAAGGVPVSKVIPLPEK